MQTFFFKLPWYLLLLCVYLPSWNLLNFIFSVTMWLVLVSWEFSVHQSELSALSPVKVSWVNSSTLLGYFCPAVRAIISKSCYRIVSDYVTKFKLLIICFPDLCRRCRFLASSGSGSGPRVWHQLNKVVEQVFVNKKAFLNFFLKWNLDVFRSNFLWRLLFLFYSLPTNNTITCTAQGQHFKLWLSHFLTDYGFYPHVSWTFFQMLLQPQY